MDKKDFGPAKDSPQAPVNGTLCYESRGGEIKTVHPDYAPQTDHADQAAVRERQVFRQAKS